MSAVELAHENSVEVSEYFFGILRKRKDIVKVCKTYIQSLCTRFLNCRKEMSVCSTLADYEKLSLLRAVHLELRNIVRHSLHLLHSFPDHHLMILRI